MSPLKKNTIKKKRVNKLLELKLELNIREDKEYKVEAMKYSTIDTKIAVANLSKLYYLVSLKYYLEDESIWEPGSAIMHL